MNAFNHYLILDFYNTYISTNNKNVIIVKHILSFLWYAVFSQKILHIVYE